MKPASEMSQHEINRFCKAASAAYFAILQSHTRRTGECARIPELLSPKGRVPHPLMFTAEELDEADQFLLRLGVIGEYGTSEF